MTYEKSCGGIVYRKFHGNTEILLIKHVKSGYWSFPKGHVENGLPVTHAEGHGIGVRSICAIVEKYKGLSDFSVQDGRFILRVSL